MNVIIMLSNYIIIIVMLSKIQLPFQPPIQVSASMSPCMFLQSPCRNNYTHQPEQLSIVCIDCMRGEQLTHNSS